MTLLMIEDVSGVLFRHPLLARPPAGADARTNAGREGAAGGDEAVEAGRAALSREVAGLARPPARLDDKKSCLPRPHARSSPFCRAPSQKPSPPAHFSAAAHHQRALKLLLA
jgi:hypothetical protein